MTELFTIQCTTCRARLKVKDASFIGTIVNCPKCHSMVQIVPPVGWQDDGAATPAAESSAAAGGLSVADSSAEIAPSDAATTSAPETESVAAASAPQVPPLPRSAKSAPAESAPVSTSAAQTPATEEPDAQADVPPTETISSTSSMMSHLRSDWLLLAGGLASGVLVGAVAWWIVAGPVAPDEMAQAPSPAEQTAEPVAPQPQDELPAQPETDEPAATAESEPAIAIQAPDVTEPAADATPATPKEELALKNPVADAVMDQSKASEKVAPDPPATPASKPSRPSLKLEPAAKSDSPINPFDISRGGLAVPPDLSIGSPPASDGAAAKEPSPPEVQPDGNAGDPPPANALSQADVDGRMAVTLDDVKFVGVPLAQFVAFVSDVTTLPISIDDAALAKAGKRRSMPVSVHLSDTTVENAFRSALTPLGLKYELRANRLMVTVGSAK